MTGLGPQHGGGDDDQLRSLLSTALAGIDTRLTYQIGDGALMF